MPPLIAFDIDGTLFDVDEGTDYESAESVRAGTRPHVPTCDLVRLLYAYGYRVAYVTGRCRPLRALTLVQTRIHAGLPAGFLRMQRNWKGYAEMSAYKARELIDLGASVYVGDHPADAEAARIAGIPFISIEDFRAGAAVSMLDAMRGVVA